MIGELIGGGIGLIGSIFGGIKAGQERKKMNRHLDQQEADNTSWYNSNALADYTQRADAQNLMKQLRDSLTKQNRAQSNMAVVTGATPEQQAVQKELSNQVITDTYSNIGAQGQSYKDSIENAYLNRKNNLANQRMGLMEGKANSYENVMNTGMNMTAGALGSLLDAYKGKNNNPLIKN